jgi:hypothetical protein
MSGFHELLSFKSSFLFMLFSCNSNFIASTLRQSMWPNLVDSIAVSWSWIITWSMLFNFHLFPPPHVLSFVPMITMLFPIGWFYEVMPSNHTQPPHYINTQHNNSKDIPKCHIFPTILCRVITQKSYIISFIKVNALDHIQPISATQ